MRGGETEEFDQYRNEIENFLNLVLMKKNMLSMKIRK